MAYFNYKIEEYYAEYENSDIASDFHESTEYCYHYCHTQYIRGDYKRKHGIGIYVDYLGNVYEGYFNNGQRGGMGRLITPKGEVFIGLFEKAEFVKGTAMYSDNSLYVGEFKHEKPHGYGTFTTKDGLIQTGKWNYGQFLCGDDVKLQQSDNAIEISSHILSNINEKGTYKIKETGTIMSGNFENGQLNGQGKIQFLNGIILEGEFLNGKLHGQGTKTFPNDKKYKGEFKLGKMEGEGKMILPTGDVTHGKWADNVKIS